MRNYKSKFEILDIDFRNHFPTVNYVLILEH